jgi:hypothetical protein
MHSTVQRAAIVNQTIAARFILPFSMLKHRPTYRDALFAARLLKGDKYDVRADDGKFSETPGGGGGKKKEEKPKRKGTPQEIANQNRAAMSESLGLAELDGAMARLDAGMGGKADEEKAQQLVDRGLAVKDPDTGRYDLSPEGKKYFRAAKKGDTEAATAAVNAAKGRAEKTKAKADAAKEKTDAKTKATEDKAKAKADKEKAEAEKKPKGGGGGKKEEKPKGTPQEIANQNRAATAEQLGISTELDGAMARLSAGMGGKSDDKNVDALVERGLAQRDPDTGFASLSPEGKKYYAAAAKGNIEAATAALAFGKERAEKNKVKSTKTKKASYRDALFLSRSVDPGLIQKRATPVHDTFVLFDTDSIAKADDDQRMVYGIASTEDLDGQPGVWEGQRYHGDIVDAGAVKDALADYMEWANVREMHGSKAVGVVVKAEVISGKLHIAAKIEDDDAWKKIKAGVYKGFSIGGRALKAALQRLADGRIARRILKLLLSEISLVDRPANSGARILLFKGADMPGEQDTHEQPDALAQLTLLLKAAPDPMKATTQLQAIRDELELSGDVEGASLMTQAISLVLQAAGEAEAPAGAEEEVTEEVTEEEPAADDVEMMADEEEEDPAALMMAARASIQKASRLRMGKRLPGIEAVAKQMLQLAADGGSEWAMKLLKGDAPIDTKAMGAELQKIITGEITKAMQPVAAGILSIHDRTAKLEAQPAPGGPARNLTSISKRLGAEQTAETSATKIDPQALQRLRQLAATESHPGRRAQYQEQLKQLEAVGR